MKYNPYHRYSLYWWKFWLNVPRDVGGFIKCIIDYSFLLWHDRDFDYAYLIHMMRFKIRRMRKCMGKVQDFFDTKRIVGEMERIDLLLRNIEDGGDPDNEWSLHWGQWHRGKALNEPCSAGKDICHKASMDGMVRDDRNWHELWKYIDKHMRGWWI